MSRFTDNDDGSILDNETGLVWAKEDSWPVAQDWLNFQESLEFVDEMNKKDYLGFHDWRIPEREEIEKIFMADSTILARSNNEIHLDPLFAPGGGNASWCLPFDQQAAFYFSYTSGNAQQFDQDYSQGYVRLVRLYPDE
jgi:hypothetical protein|tara:strand:- start:802 stop:1218 length:417 start_codon:yes stop_codon:yes gene_type:complete